MQKVVELLEKHVQWVALGLGAIWLLLMTWQYVIIPPAAVEIGGETLTAGQVDEYAVAHAVRPLEEEMKPKEAPSMMVDNFASRWLERMDWQNIEPIRVARLIGSQPAIPDASLTPLRSVMAQGRPGDASNVVAQGGPANAVATLPSPAPTPTVSDWRFGRSTIIEPPPVQVFGQAPPAAPFVPGEIDKDWVTQSFKVSLPALGELFKKHQVPAPPVGMTAFLKVEMVRQELLPDGKWGNEKTLEPLNTGMARQPFPAPKAGIHQENAYLNWAVQNTGDIVQPAFYQTVLNKGDMWERPGEPAQLANMGGFQPQQFLVGPIPPDLLPEQRKAVLDLRRQAAVERRQQQRQAAPRGTRRGAEEDPAMMDGAEYAPIDPARPKFLQVRPQYPRGGYPGGAYPGEDPAMMEDAAMMGMEGEFGFQQQPTIMGVGVPDVDYPAGQFDPATWWVAPPLAPGQVAPVNPRPQDMSFWAHDDTVVPGKTYRYRARYIVKNPLYQQPAVVKNPAVARQFAIASEFSEWGPAIEVPPLTNFFIANANLHQGKVRFDVYHWEKGLQHHTTVSAGPGDVITKMDNGINFATGHMVVELRPDLRSRDPVVYLTSGSGQPVVRTQRGDQNHPIYKKLKEIIAAAAPQQAAALPR